MAGLVPFNKNKSSLRPTGFEDFYNMLDDFFGDTWVSRRNLFNDTFKLDVQESDKEYLIEAELPGVKKEEINIDFSEGRLTISVDRAEDIEENKKNYIHKERRYSSMKRSIYLQDAKSEGFKAKLENGVLNVNIPRQDKNQNKYKINID